MARRLTSGITLNYEDLEELQRKLHPTYEEWNKALKQSVKQGVAVIKKATVQNLRKIQRKDGRLVKTNNLAKFVRMAEMKEFNGRGAYVSILGSNSKKFRARVARLGTRNTSFVLKFFELGTQERFTKKGAYRGKITQRVFLSPAVEANKADVEVNMSKTIETNLRRIISKNVMKGK